ncbi:MAG: HAMP domain-containing protein [Anaerolineae bacterium]
MMNNKRFIGLRVKLLVGFTLLFSAVFGFIFYWIYRFSDEQTLTYIREQLINTIKGAAQGMDGDMLVALAAEGRPNADGFSDDPRYEALLDWLQLTQSFEPQAWPYLYIAGSRPNEIIFVVDLWARYDPDKAAPFMYAEDYEDLYPGLTDLHVVSDASGRLAITTDQWGEWVTVCMPVTNAAGERVGAIGIDFEASYVRQVRRSVAGRVTTAFIVAYVILFAVVYFATQTVARPVEALGQVARQVGQGDYTQRFTRPAAVRYIDEFDVLAETFNEMVTQIDQREQSLRRQVAELRIEINEAKRQRNVEEVVDTEFFRDLQAKAQQLRQR